MNYRALCIVTALGIAGCSGGGATTGFACPALAFFDSGATLVTPAKGATGVPVTIGVITFTVTASALRQGRVTLAPSDNSSPVVGSPILTDGNNISSTVIPTLRPGVTYSATVAASTDTGHGCSIPVSGNLGSFTTQ